MFRNTQRKLYEKEIEALKQQNKNLLARCERAEKYMNEYKKLNKQMQLTIHKYDTLYKQLKKTEQSLNEYQAMLESK
ncbi:MAG: hypothetical protein J6D02_00665 [Lachnospira sp.]|nr:hypothetical protein [Lachnospira sp.]